LAYMGGILKNMTTKNLTSDQKLDLLLKKVTTLDEKVTGLDDKVSVLDGKVTVLQKNQKDIIKTVGEIAILAGKTADKLNEHCNKTEHLESVRSFSPNISGAFVA